ncbi:MAG: putative alpha/beta-fold hydrolase [Pseudohongiellaceae bacterium]|jgi:predicted alpha/beta-fold hydrolase
MAADREPWLPPDEGAPFEPYPGLAGFHRMTLAGSFLRLEAFRRHPPEERREVPLPPDGATTVLCSWQRERAAPVLVLVHGMGGSARSVYLRGTARRAWAAGMHVLRLNLRGAAGVERLSRRGYHAGLVEDLRLTLATWVEGRGLGPVLLAGFSLGGNVVLRLAALDGPRVAAGVAAVSPAVDLTGCSAAIDSDPGVRRYRDSFVSSLAASLRRRERLHPGSVDLATLGRVVTLRDFDAAFTARDYGFVDVDDYYQRASAGPLLADLALPTLVIHARDDRLVPAAGLLASGALSNPWVRLALSDHGGHCAFIGARVPAGQAEGSQRPGRKAPMLPGFWAEQRLVAFLGAVARRAVAAELPGAGR